jgi:hypothetical protein
MCLATKQGGNGGVLAIGDDYSKDKRFQWTDIVEDQWYTGVFYFFENFEKKMFSWKWDFFSKWCLVYMTNWIIGKTSLGVPGYDLNWDGVCSNLWEEKGGEGREEKGEGRGEGRGGEGRREKGEGRREKVR